MIRAYKLHKNAHHQLPGKDREASLSIFFIILLESTLSVTQAEMVFGAQTASLRRDRHGLAFALEVERIAPDDPL